MGRCGMSADALLFMVWLVGGDVCGIVDLVK